MGLSRSPTPQCKYVEASTDAVHPSPTQVLLFFEKTQHTMSDQDNMYVFKMH